MLDGEKLHGRWHLVRMRPRDRGERHDNWLLIKGKDDAARSGRAEDILDEEPLSVASGRSMEEIAAGKGKKRVWHSNRASGRIRCRAAADPARVQGAIEGAAASRAKLSQRNQAGQRETAKASLAGESSARRAKPGRNPRRKAAKRAKMPRQTAAAKAPSARLGGNRARRARLCPAQPCDAA